MGRVHSVDRVLVHLVGGVRVYLVDKVGVHLIDRVYSMDGIYSGGGVHSIEYTQ